MGSAAAVRIGQLGEAFAMKLYPNGTRMNPTNHGFDISCPLGKTIDVKTASYIDFPCAQGWAFRINKNKIADFFQLIALSAAGKVIHKWLIPGDAMIYSKTCIGKLHDRSNLQIMDTECSLNRFRRWKK